MFIISKATAKSKTYPAPIGGLNARDSVAAMPPEDAVILNNWWVKPSTCVVRSGSTPWATGFSTPVESLIEYYPPAAVAKLFAAAGTNIYDITSNGAIGAAVQSGLSNARWQDLQITTAGGSFLYIVNGVDKPRLYDGATWTAVDGASTPAITGVVTSTFIHSMVFKNRLWFVEANSTRVWYLPVTSIGGAAVAIDLGSIFKLGGYLMACYSWTIDAGAGADDLAVFISSNGEVAVYKGTDPATAATWSIVGLFSLGRPLGRRCGIKFGGDLLVLCEEGVYPLGKGLLSSSIDRRTAVSDKIQNSISADVVNYRDNFGWELCLFPEQAMLIVNVPVGNGMNRQYAQNTITQAWTQFTGWDARCWIAAAKGLFFGDGTSVKKAWTGVVDGSDVITFDALTSLQYFDAPTQNKYFTLLRPYLNSTGTPSIAYGISGDFIPSEPTGVFTYTPPTGMVWGSMSWGSMVWGGSLQSIIKWNTVGGVYNSAAVRLKGQNNGAQLEWAATDLVFQIGGIL
jgi:hypothetical protein